MKKLIFFIISVIIMLTMTIPIYAENSEGYPYDEPDNYVYSVKTPPSIEEKGSEIIITYDIWVGDKETGRVISKDKYEAVIKNIPENVEVAFFRDPPVKASENDAAIAVSEYYIRNYNNIRYDEGDWNSFVNERKAIESEEKKFTEVFLSGRKGLLLSNVYSSDIYGSGYMEGKELGNIYVYLNEIALPNGVACLNLSWCINILYNIQETERYDNAKPYTDALYKKTIADVMNKINNYGPIMVEVKKTASVGNYNEFISDDPDNEEAEASKDVPALITSIIAISVISAVIAAAVSAIPNVAISTTVSSAAAVAPVDEASPAGASAVLKNPNIPVRIKSEINESGSINEVIDVADTGLTAGLPALEGIVNKLQTIFNKQTAKVYGEAVKLNHYKTQTETLKSMGRINKNFNNLRSVLKGIRTGLSIVGMGIDTLENMQDHNRQDNSLIKGDDVGKAVGKSIAVNAVIAKILEKNPIIGVAEVINYVSIGDTPAGQITSPVTNMKGAMNMAVDAATDLQKAKDRAQAGAYGAAIKHSADALALSGEAIDDPSKFIDELGKVGNDKEFYKNMQETASTLWRDKNGNIGYVGEAGEAASQMAVAMAETAADMAKCAGYVAGTAFEKTSYAIKSLFN